ncbi:hypothetical protein LTR37_018471 [Vermiconidia calcicola]|uniref:Uncharacterized protein n=1 Tax=Vermiconidia calcicola TaxID=1690605 RepID=A0ACC3MID9_9PEZI|nr:hypothetical protein LTR37_018471 [Vermiconidia calcicola]
MSMQTEPPPYAAPAPTHRSILDLRAQIIANGSVMKPRINSERPSDDHIELIVGKTPAPTSNLQQPNRTHWTDEKQAMSSVRDGNTVPTNTAGSASSATRGGKHYAVLMRRSRGSRSINVIMKGEPKDTVEEALEWMLERTEMLMHDQTGDRIKMDVQ